jgi:regulator of RNase E activity RraB
LTKNTVFVIGAGASKEANLPTGYELKSKISQLLDIRFPNGYQQTSGDYVITTALRRLVQNPEGRSGDINPYLHEAWHIRDALPQAISIDNFIDAHRDNDKIALCGKLAIVRSILDAEKDSLLYFEKSRVDSNINFSRLEKTWYIPFFQLLTENCQKTELTERFKSITLIVFNYDRCIEHFIYYALQNYYRISGTDAAELVKNINIYHPYGDVGTLPWIDQSGAMEFGMEPNTNQLLELAQKIKTFTEGTDPNVSKIIEIRKRMGVADRVVFLGFAFHKLNMQLITPELLHDTNNSEVKCFATVSGISFNDREVIDEQIKELYRGFIKVNMANSYCGDFFSEYWRSLSF